MDCLSALHTNFFNEPGRNVNLDDVFFFVYGWWYVFMVLKRTLPFCM